MLDLPTPPADLIIADLRDHPWHVPALAHWLKATFAVHRPHITTATYEERLRAGESDRPLPRTWIALVGDELAGCARLTEADHPDRRDLTPWLASVFVVPDRRRRGIGSALVQTVQQAAHDAGFAALYLFTPDQARLYGRQGFVVIGTVASPENGRPCDLMVWQPSRET
jgi:predicted N-acetyltransferase YhbS